MNCQQGDLAFIVNVPRQLAEVRDRIVRVKEPCVIAGEPGWILEQRVNFVMVAAGRSTITGESFGVGAPVYFDRLQDKYLRPIRGGNGDDETLTWVGKPNETPAASLTCLASAAPQPDWNAVLA